MPVIKSAGILSKPNSPEAAYVVPELIHWLHKHDISIRVDLETTAYALGESGNPREHVPDGTDILIVLGGDGTLLSAARAVGGRDIPIFAVNLGSLGFLAAIKLEDMYSQLEAALRGDLTVDRRQMLRTELHRDGKCIAAYDGLNDMVLAKAEIARMIDLQVHVDGSFVCVYKSDGLIVGTPTGSTAYSLSAGGPIVFPSVAALSITPICPHMLSNRPVIVPDSSVIETTVLGADQTTYLTIDGQVGELLKKGDLVVCRRSEHSISLVRPPNLLFFDVLREKLKWGGR